MAKGKGAKYVGETADKMQKRLEGGDTDLTCKLVGKSGLGVERAHKRVGNDSGKVETSCKWVEKSALRVEGVQKQVGDWQ